MFAELPKLFGNTFALGYFLPSTFLLGVSIFLFNEYGFDPHLISYLKSDFLAGATIIGFISFLMGVFLLGANRLIIRILEGYGEYNPARLLLQCQIKKYKRIQNDIEKLDEEYRNRGENFPPELRKKRNRLMEQIVEQFPDQEAYILPTSFGNTIRAFEVYPRVIYGIEGIAGWNRLIAVIPKDFLAIIDDAKSHVDFWINFGVVSMILVIEYIGFWGYSGQVRVLWIPVLAILTIIVASNRAESSAAQWGELIKSSFDVFLGKLQQEIGLDTDEKGFGRKWSSYSQAIVYRRRESMIEAKSSTAEKKDSVR